jgi:hypothetical protein
MIRMLFSATASAVLALASGGAVAATAARSAAMPTIVGCTFKLTSPPPAGQATTRLTAAGTCSVVSSADNSAAGRWAGTVYTNAGKVTGTLTLSNAKGTLVLASRYSSGPLTFTNRPSLRVTGAVGVGTFTATRGASLYASLGGKHGEATFYSDDASGTVRMFYAFA